MNGCIVMSLWRHKVRPMMQFFSIFLHFISVFYGNMVRFSHAASHTSLYIRRSVLLQRSGGGVLVVHDKIKYCDMRYTVTVGWSIDFTVLLWMRESWMRESWMCELRISQCSMCESGMCESMYGQGKSDCLIKQCWHNVISAQCCECQSEEI